MKIITLLTLVISAVVGLSGVSDLTSSTGRFTAIAGLLGVAISSGALAICSSIDAMEGKLRVGQNGDSSSPVQQMNEWEAERARREALARQS